MVPAQTPQAIPKFSGAPPTQADSWSTPASLTSDCVSGGISMASESGEPSVSPAGPSDGSTAASDLSLLGGGVPRFNSVQLAAINTHASSTGQQVVLGSSQPFLFRTEFRM
jgi:hypothetical protein